MIDYWLEEEMKVGSKESDKDVAFHFMDFLFASQDASTSSITWLIAMLAKHPEILGIYFINIIEILMY